MGQHANEAQGYVESFSDTSNKGAKSAPMVEGGSGGEGTYGTKHEEKSARPVADMTEGKSEGSLDAYTKIAGEGARWKCVREHAAALQNDTWFFCAHPTVEGKFVGIQFVNLWKCWDKPFKKAYDIPHSVVVEKLKAGALTRKTLAREDLSPKDFDLERGPGSPTWCAARGHPSTRRATPSG